jgi:hypothetical protein
VFTLTLRHGDFQSTHSTALDLMILAIGHADTDPDHKLSFSRSKVLSEEFRGHFDNGVEVACMAILTQSHATFTTVIHAVDQPVIHYDRYHRFSAIPRGLRQTVLLV